jgi:hypothetical protein
VSWKSIKSTLFSETSFKLVVNKLPKFRKEYFFDLEPSLKSQLI